MKRILCCMLVASCVFVFSACGNSAAEGSSAPDMERNSTITAESSENVDEISEVSSNEGGASDISDNAEEFPKLELSAWNGTWNSMMTLLDEPDFEAAYPTLAKAYEEETTAEEVKADYAESYRSDFAAVVIENDNVTFYVAPAASDGALAGEAVFTGTYSEQGVEPVIGEGYSYAWYKFMAAEEGPYQYLLMLPVDTEEGFTHWHFRYGGEGFEVLLALDEWWPTAIEPQTTAQMVVDVYTAE